MNRDYTSFGTKNTRSQAWSIIIPKLPAQNSTPGQHEHRILDIIRPPLDARVLDEARLFEEQA